MEKYIKPTMSEIEIDIQNVMAQSAPAPPAISDEPADDNVEVLSKDIFGGWDD